MHSMTVGYFPQIMAVIYGGFDSYGRVSFPPSSVDYRASKCIGYLLLRILRGKDEALKRQN